MAKKKKAQTKATKPKKSKIKGWEHIAVQKVGTIAPGGILSIEVPCPNGKFILGGGAHCQDVPVGSATNYVLKSSWPVKMSDGTMKWMAVWTNTYDTVHPQVITFTAYLICAS